MWRPPKFRGLALCRPGEWYFPFLSTKESKPLWMADNSCGYDSLRAACLRWMTNGKAQSHQWSLDILLYCCTCFRKQVQTRWQRTRSMLSIIPCSVFLIETTWHFSCRDFGCCLDDRTWRGYKDRQYVTALRSDKAGRDLTDLCRFVSPSLFVQGSLRPPNA